MFWDGTRWIDERAAAATPPPTRRRGRDWLATGVMIIGVAALAVPFVATNAAVSSTHRLLASWRGSFETRVFQESTPYAAYSGSWDRLRDDQYLGSSAAVSAQLGASVTFTFTGSAVSWIGPEGPDQGKAAVYVDGEYVRTVDNYSRSLKPRETLFTTHVSQTTPHTLTIRALATAAREAVSVDAFVVRGQPLEETSAQAPAPPADPAPADPALAVAPSDPTPTSTPTPRPTVTPTPTPRPTASPTRADAPATAAPTPRPTASPTPTPTPTPRPTATPTPRPTATPRPRPTATPRPDGHAHASADGNACAHGDADAPADGHAHASADGTADAHADADAHAHVDNLVLRVVPAGEGGRGAVGGDARPHRLHVRRGSDDRQAPHDRGGAGQRPGRSAWLHRHGLQRDPGPARDHGRPGVDLQLERGRRAHDGLGLKPRRP